MRRRRNDDNYHVGDESATKSAYCRKLPQVCQVRSKFPNCRSNRLSHYLFAYIIPQGKRKTIFFVNLFLERLNPQAHKIRHFCLAGAEDGGFVVCKNGVGFEPHESSYL